MRVRAALSLFLFAAAPLVALRAIREGCNVPLDDGLKIEQRLALEVEAPDLRVHEALRRVLLGDAGGLEQEHERAGAAIHDRHFRRIHLDDGVVDAEFTEVKDAK